MTKVLKDKLKKNPIKDESAKKAIKSFNKEIEEEKASQFAKASGLPYVDLNLFPMDADDIRIVGEEDSRRCEMAVFQKIGKNIKLAVLDPKNPKTLEFIEQFEKEKGYKIKTFIVSDSSMEKAWSRYKDGFFLENIDALRMSLTGKDLESFEKEFKGLLDLKKRAKEIPTTEIINIIMAGAIKMKSSDIHFEAQEESVRLRYRIDGVLQNIGELPLDIYRFILSRVKMMGKMKVNVRKIAQDGHFSIVLEDSRIDVRVSIIPGNLGEEIVMRLLNQKDALLNVDSLGLRGLAYEKVKKQLEKTTGMILTTGPTGSGKTTMLYALINKINTPEVKIITIEDPVEYQIKGISQTQVAKDKNYTFAQGLRAIVRQDPDVILVGEIRDEETADIAVNASLTGHLVLSTLHTNNAVASVARMIELGVKPNSIAPSINALVSQRLVRRLCPDCKEKYKPAKETADDIKKILSIISPKAQVEIPKEIEYFYRPKGCPKCHNLGYRGRIGIFEVLTISEEIEKMILEMAGEAEMTKQALEEGMVTMAQDGILKSVEGITSIEEVWRVTGQTEFLESLYEKLMEQSLSRSVAISEEDFRKVSEKTSSFKELSELILKSNQKDIFRYVITAALLLKVGDIHVEPEAEKVKIRFRIDGILQDVGELPLNEYPTFLGNLKLLCGMKAEAREGVKDSRFSIVWEKPFEFLKETKVDVRVSIILGGFGETAVMRFLNQSAVALDIENLGIRKENLDKILHEIKKPNGIFLNTGPTGSGKTTTLYSLLKTLNKPEVKIITVEDPIEYQLPGILQTQANEESGYTFGTALKSLMRQNPDILMVGEIRDEETAGIAVQSSLTGHLILSTLHTNDAAGAIPRLLNMGVRPDDLATASNAFMAQRLVRKLCECKEEVKASPEQEEHIKKILGSISEKAGIKIPKNTAKIYAPKGCEKCNGIGYKGRTTISEVMVVGKEIEEMIYQNALSSQIKEKAIENGMISMAQDGILKVLEGETSLEEVERVVEE